MAGKEPTGVQFPVDDKGQRSTTEINREAFAQAAQAVSQEAAQQIRGEAKWRGRYTRHVVETVRLGCQRPENAIRMAEAGLTYLHNKMEFIRDGKTFTLPDAMKSIKNHSFQTGVVEGSAPKMAPKYALPYKGERLQDERLRLQIDTWVRLGVMEMSAGAALNAVLDNPEWLNLSDFNFVMLGATSAMGPFNILMELGATVVAIDIDRPGVWEKLIKTCRNSTGRMVFPMRKKQTECKDDATLFASSGCDLLNETPEICNWLRTVNPDKTFIIGAYAYLDGPLFLRISMAMDSIIGDLTQTRKKTGIAYLCTPTDAHVVPAAAREAASANFRRAPAWAGVIRMLLGLGGLRTLAPNRCIVVPQEGGKEDLSIMDALVNEQGPNYCLAKRLQHWRAMVSHQKGCVVSSNIAPSTATVSVVHNRQFAWAYGGMPQFKPLEVFQQETSAALMTGLLLNDVRNPGSVSNPARPLPNPHCLFSDTSAHGGAWRCGFKFGSIGIPAATLHFVVGVARPKYLLAYNLAQAVGWAIALALLVMHLVNPTGATAWGAVGPTIGFFQRLAILEVVHSLLGVVPAPVVTTGMQVLSRLVVCALADAAKPAAQDGPWIMAFSGAWAITEVVRYLFYALGTMNIKVPVLTFLRYTMFLVLYPLGVAGELGTVWNCLDILSKYKTATDPLVHGTGRFINSTTSFYLVALPVWIIGLASLYSYMLAQRKRVLGRKRTGKGRK